ncbi:perakine reductase-like isoform X1 [Coffea arabica]|uniref:Perakine reductase-like isoform X1 n=1 Tax=Coffea arabica TaxID=13443 RepID=A0ABM4X8X2_COFAR
MEEKNQIQIPRVKLSSQGLEVSKLGFGCGGLSGYYNAPLSHEEGCSVIKEAFHRGITFFDTSDAYGRNNDNEILVGKALKQLPREKVQLATKFGISVLPESTKAMGLVDQIRITGTPEYVRKCCEASLKRLDLDYIDLYYQHRVDVSVPIEETMEELKKLVEEGKVKYIGLSEASPDTIRRAHAVHPITALQMEYSLLYRGIEKEVIPLCRELGIGIVAYSPLGRGFFGGKAAAESINSESILGSIPMFAGENLERNKVHYARIAELAIKHGCTPSQLALAWLFHQGDDVVPIPGTTKLMNLDNNIRSLVVKLNKEDSKSISEAVPVDSVVGERQLPCMYKYSWDFATTPPKNKNSSAT